MAAFGGGGGGATTYAHTHQEKPCFGVIFAQCPAVSWEVGLPAVMWHKIGNKMVPVVC